MPHDLDGGTPNADPNTVVLDPAVYWELKASYLEFCIAQREAQIHLSQLQQNFLAKKIAALGNNNIDPKADLLMDDKIHSITPQLSNNA